MAEDWQARALAAEAEVQRLTAIWNTCGSAYPGYEGQLCPFCVHTEGQLVSMCGLHKRLADAEAEVIGRVKRLVEAEERALKLSEELQKYTTPADDRISELAGAFKGDPAWPGFQESMRREEERINRELDPPLPASRISGNDRRLAEIRARVEAGYVVPPADVPYLLSEVDRLKGTLASYADSRPLRETKTSDEV